jgi:hypothetical protein
MSFIISYIMADKINSVDLPWYEINPRHISKVRDEVIPYRRHHKTSMQRIQKPRNALSAAALAWIVWNYTNQTAATWKINCKLLVESPRSRRISHTMSLVRVASEGYSLMYRNDWTVTMPMIETRYIEDILWKPTTSLPERLYQAWTYWTNRQGSRHSPASQKRT